MTTITDDFNRANEATILSPWSEVDGDTELNANKMGTGNTSVDCAGRITTPSLAADQEASGIIAVTGTTGGGPGIGPVVRASGTPGAHTLYRFVADHGASNNCRLGRFVVGSFTVLDTFTQAWSDGARFKLRVVGQGAATVLTMYIDGVLVRTYNDTTSTIASGQPGYAYSSSCVSATFDDFIATDELAGAVGRRIGTLSATGW